MDLTIRVVEEASVPTVQLVDNSNGGTIIESRPLADTSQVVITGSEQSDTLTVDSSTPSSLPISFTDTSANDHDILTVLGTDQTWNITGPNAGTVGNVTFAGIENLTGGADNQDMFTFEASGSILGVVDGGAGGFDTIKLAGGYFQKVAYTVSGPDSGTIARDGDLITYSGFEPLIDTTTGPSRSFSGTAFADHISLIDRGTPTDDSFTISMDTGEDLIFIDASSITDLTIDAAAGDDRIDVDPLDSGFNGDLTIDAGTGNDQITLNAKTGHGAYTLDGGGDSGDLIKASGIDLTLTKAKMIASNLDCNVNF